MKNRRDLSAFSASLFFFLLFTMACGGGGYNPPPPTPKPALSVTPVSLAFSAVQGGSNPASQTFIVTNSGSSGSILNYTVAKTQTWLALGGTSGSLAASKSAAVSVGVNVSGIAAGTYTDTITVSAGGATNSPQTAAVTLTITAPLTISVEQPLLPVKYGDEISLPVTYSGNQAPPSCSVTSGPGSVNFGGNVVIYSLPLPTTTTISVWAATFSCTVSNSAGKTATATVNITLEYDMPAVQKVVTATDHTTIFSPREGMMFIYIYCSGCYVGGTVNLGNKTSSAAVALGPENFLSPGKVQFLLGIDSSHYHPDWIVASVASPADGHGGGTSEPAYAAFVGNQSTYAASSTEIFQLYQADPNTLDDLGRPSGVVYVFDAATGNFIRKLPVGGLAYAITVDDATGYIVTTYSNGVGLWGSDGQPHGLLSDPNYNAPMGVAAKSGYVCAPEDGVGLLSGFNILTRPYTYLGSLSGVGRAPWNAMMTKFGNHFACITFDAEDNQLSVVKFPEMALWNFATLVGLTPMSQLQVPPDGGWQLAAFEPVYDSITQTTTVTVGVLSQYDGVVVVLSLAADSSDNITITELRRVQLDAASNPIRIAADNANGNLVVGFINTDTATTTFAKVAVSGGGDPTALTSSTGRLISGFGVSADGAKLEACGQGSCEFLDNQ